jgi:hypothetical protein
MQGNGCKGTVRHLPSCCTVIHPQPAQQPAANLDCWVYDGKETKLIRKQADRAERMARSVSDVEIAQNFLSMARAYRAQAEVLKAKRKAERKRR